MKDVSFKAFIFVNLYPFVKTNQEEKYFQEIFDAYPKRREVCIINIQNLMNVTSDLKLKSNLIMLSLLLNRNVY